MNYDKKHNDVLTEALKAEARTEQAQYFTGEPETFSPEFERRMARLATQTHRRVAWRRKPGELLRKARDWVVELFTGEYDRAGYYGRRRMQRDAACVLMVSILVFSTGMAKAPASLGRTELTFYQHSGEYSVAFQPQRGYVYPKELELRFTFAHLPAGYVLDEQWQHWGSHEQYTVWRHPHGGEIRLIQDTLDGCLELNVDHVPGQEIRVGRYRGQLFVCENHIVLLWTTDYAFMLEVHDPQMSPTEVIALAEMLVQDEGTIRS